MDFGGYQISSGFFATERMHFVLGTAKQGTPETRGQSIGGGFSLPNDNPDR